jgi:hypothetical protein
MLLDIFDGWKVHSSAFRESLSSMKPTLIAIGDVRSLSTGDCLVRRRAMETHIGKALLRSTPLPNRGKRRAVLICIDTSSGRSNEETPTTDG